MAIGAVDAWLDEELPNREATAISHFSYSTLIRYRRTGQSVLDAVDNLQHCVVSCQHAEEAPSEEGCGGGVVRG